MSRAAEQQHTSGMAVSLLLAHDSGPSSCLPAGFAKTFALDRNTIVPQPLSGPPLLAADPAAFAAAQAAVLERSATLNDVTKSISLFWEDG